MRDELKNKSAEVKKTYADECLERADRKDVPELAKRLKIACDQLRHAAEIALNEKLINYASRLNQVVDELEAIE